VTFDVRGLRERIVAELERENRNRRLRAEIEKKPVPSDLKPPCDWVAVEAKGK
jgi:hypothetical protein